MQSRTSTYNYGSVQQPHLEQPSRKCCKIKYRVRYFYSKGAILVLFWTTLVSTAIVEFDYSFLISSHNIAAYFQTAFAGIAIYICFPLVGWLADAKFGNFKTFKFGAIVIFLATLGGIGAVIINEYCDVSNSITEVYNTVYSSVGAAGVISCFLTSLQLGLDQMPDASSSNNTSFIAWFVFSVCAGVWLSKALPSVILGCDSYNELALAVRIGLSFFPCICLTVACCSMFILAPRYLVIEPNSPKALKTIYQVLKFAAKHKAPLNRSAFTYWEEDIPSRLDLGKSRYGGPFTTEQVEDVKTLFKLLTLLIPISVVVFGLAITSAIDFIIFGYTEFCFDSDRLLSTFTANSWLIPIFVTILYELMLFPFVRNKLPSTLKRIGIAAFLIFVIESLHLTEAGVNLSIIQTANQTESLLTLQQVEQWVNLVLGFSKATVSLFLLNGILEFVCAQSPYNMRGLLTGCTFFLTLFSTSSGNFVFDTDSIISMSVTTRSALSTGIELVGLILFCVLARWYKMRVRDENYSPHRVIEEVYDRYLSRVQ